MTQPISERTPSRLMTVATLSGFLVRDRQSQDLGCFEELMIDAETGRIAYAVLSFGSFLGTGGKLWAVPWNALELNAEQRVFVLDADRATLASAPAFQEEKWPDFTDRAWGLQVHGHYGIRPYWETGGRVEEATVAKAAG